MARSNPANYPQPWRYQIERNKHFVTVRAMSAVQAAVGCYPDISPVSWTVVDQYTTVYRSPAGDVTVTRLR